MDALPQPRGCTNLKLRQATRLVTQHYDNEISKTGLKITQYSLLSHVISLGPVRPGDLARALRMDASTLTRNLRPLQDAGWVEVAAGGDARSRSVQITDAGRAKRQEAQRHWRVAQDGLNERLGADRVMALHALLDETIALLDTEPAARP
ncbi:MarR family winged helix-turn-helix transcriptional regulator [Paracidovorax wautersii]|uniref:DNA-binding MarR family transcriptional regulator n=1 Tax=Paracidovorax wautersii TaxID=1177982 RepID=A0ABU1IGD7_9BURK|nr:MarR family winged helix-turn-helix transcriptional regulator [Paracidovorax wautersii]MDR6215618.1 DNA-binding MarR family transcriptional regulator [Paracidovorax wautersii]